RLELFVEAAAERVLALAQRVFALTHPRFGLVQGFALARREPLLVLERAHVVIDLREMLGQLRFARAEIRARRRDHRWIQTQAAGHFEREASPRRSVEQLIRRRERFRVEAE